MDREQFLEVYRHSLAHILAKAVMEIFGRENVQIAIGPQIADGMYYDFLLPRGISTEDFPAIEQKMKEIMKRKETWTRKVVGKEEALHIFKGQKYKEELINDLPEGETITVYYTGDDFVDLCRGPHVENSAELLSVAYKIRAVSSAYWRGDEKRDSLQRVYVYAFPDPQ
jgi:threonyl-tRNA synthetase